MYPIKRNTAHADYAHTEFGKVRVIRRHNTATEESLKFVRPHPERIHTVPGKITKLNLPAGCFNAGLATAPAAGFYICVYRPDEYHFRACLLDADFNKLDVDIDLGISNCADPRLIWIDDKRLMIVYSSFAGDHDWANECIRGAILLDLNRSADFISPLEPFLISPPGIGRQKNWVPFMHDGAVHLIATAKPHSIYVMPEIGKIAVPAYSTDWLSPWFNNEFFRGNTPPVQLADGNFLNTYHSVVRKGRMHWYDNGCYLFEGKPPFKVVKAGWQTYLPAEAAVEPHFRKAGVIQVCFPVGMVNTDNKLLISYGDNDSAVKILETTVDDMFKTMRDVY